MSHTFSRTKENIFSIDVPGYDDKQPTLSILVQDAIAIVNGFEHVGAHNVLDLLLSCGWEEADSSHAMGIIDALVDLKVLEWQHDPINPHNEAPYVVNHTPLLFTKPNQT